MKVVLFCGGLGTRLREHSETIPKPLVQIGERPIIWHLMKYYAHFGHKEFILCLGFKGEMLKEYFLNYDPNVSRSFTLEPGGATSPTESDIADWRITFVDTGLHSNLGERLLRVRKHIGNDEIFLANYSDQLSDLNLTQYFDTFKKSGTTASFVAVRPTQSFHAVTVGSNGLVDDIRSVKETDFLINGGYFIFRRSIFDYIREGDELVEEPFRRLIRKRQLYAHRHLDFWACMDTFKDKIMLDAMHGNGDRPWEVWHTERTDVVKAVGGKPAGLTSIDTG